MKTICFCAGWLIKQHINRIKISPTVLIPQKSLMVLTPQWTILRSISLLPCKKLCNTYGISLAVFTTSLTSLTVVPIPRMCCSVR